MIPTVAPSSAPALVLLLLLIFTAAVGVRGQNGGRRGDIPQDYADSDSVTAPVVDCSCSSSVVIAVIVTSLVFLCLAAVWWCFQVRKRRKALSKQDVEALGRAAYDNPHFQDDEGTEHGTEGVPAKPKAGGVQTTCGSQSPSGTQKAANSLEREKSTLEKVMAAVIRGSQSDAHKKTQDDSFLGTKDIIVPLQGHDFAGLGFTVSGNLKEGLFVKSVLSRGPASESGQVNAGDQITSITVLTDHIVFKDALTILSYASPYPVLLHLNKQLTAGSHSSTSTLSSKGKLTASSNSSLKLVHPAFRSQSQADLAKIGDIDISRVKWGNLNPPSKGKSTGANTEISKAQSNRNVQRKAESRHSERAIDVPGVEVNAVSRSSEEEGKTPEAAKLTNVEVHMPMSCTVNISPSVSSKQPATFKDAGLSATTENVKSFEADVEGQTDSKIHSKTKFGVKVFPDIAFKKGFRKETNLDSTDGKNGTPNLKNENEIEVKHNEENSKIELNFDLNSPKMKGSDIKSSSGTSASLDIRKSEFCYETTSQGFKLDMPDIECPSLGVSSEKTRETEAEIFMPEIRGKGYIICGETASLALDASLPKTSFTLSSNKENLSQSPDEHQSRAPNIKSELEISEASLPCFELKGKVSTPAVDISNKDNEAGLKTELASSKDLEDKSTKKKSKHGFKIGIPEELALPKFGLKGSTTVSKDNDDMNTHVKAKHTLEEEVPTAILPELSPNINYQNIESHSDDENTNFKIDMPDINLPSFALKGIGTVNKEFDVEAQNPIEQLNQNLNTEISAFGLPSPNLEVDRETGIKMSADEESHEINIVMPDITMSSSNLKESSKTEKKFDIGNKHSSGEVKHTLSLKGPDLDAPLSNLETDVDTIQETYSDIFKKDKKKHKHGFKIGMPDINLPSFGFKGGSKLDSDFKKEMTTASETAKLDLKVEGADLCMVPCGLNKVIRIPEEQNTETYKEKLQTESSFDSKMVVPSVDIIHLGLKENLTADVDFETSELELTKKAGKLKDQASRKQANICSDEEKKGGKEGRKKYGFNIAMPSITVPSFNLKGKSASEQNYDNKHEEDLNQIIQKQGMPSVSAEAKISDRRDTEVQSDISESEPMAEFHLGKSDISIQSLSLYAKAELNEISEDENRGLGLKLSHDEAVDSEIDINFPKAELKKDADQETNIKEKDKKKSKHGFKIGMPDISLPKFSLRANAASGKDSNAKDINSKAKQNIYAETPSVSAAAISTTAQHFDSQSDEEKCQTSNTNFKIEMPAVNLLPFELRKHGEVAKDSNYESNISDIHAQIKGPDFGLLTSNAEVSEEAVVEGEDKSKKKARHGFKIAMPGISMPSFGFREKTAENDSDDSSGAEKSSLKQSLKLEGHNFDASSFNLQKPSNSNNIYDEEYLEEGVGSKSELGFKPDVPDITFRYPDARNSSYQDRRLTDYEINSGKWFELESPVIRKSSVDIHIRLKEDESVECDTENINKVILDSYKSESPELNISSISAIREESSSCPEKSNLNVGAKIISHYEIPDVTLKPSIKSDNTVSKYNLEHGFKIGSDYDVSDIIIHSEQKISPHLEMKAVGLTMQDSENVKQFTDSESDSEENSNANLTAKCPSTDDTAWQGNEPNERSGFNIEMKGPDFHFPGMKSKAEKYEELKASSNGSSKCTVHAIPKNTSYQASELETSHKEFHRSFQSNRDTYSKTDDGEEKLELEIPDFGFRADKATKLSTAYLDFKIPTAEVYNTAYDSDDHAKEGTNQRRERVDFNLANIVADIDSQTYDLSNSDSSLPDELKVEVSNRVGASGGGTCSGQLEEYDVKSKVSNFNIPDISTQAGRVGSNFGASHLYEHTTTVSEDIPDLYGEYLEDDLTDELNATDATKKKRYGFKISEPNISDISVPIRLKHSTGNESASKLDSDNNQSDEMKSFNLKLRTTNINVDDTLPTFEESKKIDLSKEIFVLLPRVKLSSTVEEGEKSSLSSTTPQYSSSSAELPRLSIDQSIKYKQNESDEWKIKGSDRKILTSNVSLLREKFNSKMKENIESSPASKSKSSLDFKLPKTILSGEANASRNIKMNYKGIDISTDEPDFIIPDLKSNPEFDTSLSPEGFSITSVAFKGNENEVNVFLPEIVGSSISKSNNHISVGNDVTDSHYFHIPATDPITSLDLLSTEIESDLPEADSDFKRASRDLGVPIPKLDTIKMTLEKNLMKDAAVTLNKPEYHERNVEDREAGTFGSAFGFRGFKKHIDVGTSEISDEQDDDEEKSCSLGNKSLSVSIQNKDVHLQESSIHSLTHTSLGKPELLNKDLPEADYDLDFKDNQFSKSGIKITLNKGALDTDYSTSEKIKSLDKPQHTKHIDTSDSECDFSKNKEFEKADENLGLTAVSKYKEPDVQETVKEKTGAEVDKLNSKTKLGIGFGLSRFRKSSESDDVETENKVVKVHEGENSEVKESIKSKPKKTFTFKGFGKSSSDTEEEISEKVSEAPMQVTVLEEKSKNKSSLSFGFKGKSIKGSDSEEAEIEKVESTPMAEGNLKKSRVKNNLTFGFKNKSKGAEQASSVSAESSAESKKEFGTEDDHKIKTRGMATAAHKGTKDTKSDTKSESEGGEEEKLSMDSKGEDSRTKTRYGIGFGFRKNHGKASSDSDVADPDDQKVHLDERGGTEKQTKESKPKSLKLGFKGFKNLKGKIQTEINKIRHDSPSSDEESAVHEAESYGEKRKKIAKKKDKENKTKRENEKLLDASEERTMTSAAVAVKENRRKKIDKKASSSSDSSSDDEEKQLEMKKKKKTKVKKKEDSKIAATDIASANTSEKKSEKSLPDEQDIAALYDRKFNIVDNTQNISASHVTIVRSEPDLGPIGVNNRLNMETMPDPLNYVVVREMKLKNDIPQIDSDEGFDCVEIRGRADDDKDAHQPLLLKERRHLAADSLTNRGYWGSDSDMDQRENIDLKANLSKTSVTSDKQKGLTDSEELKRKATSLGDLSRLHEGAVMEALLERAASLDLQNASVGPPSLHVRRLQLPGSSATSIDEADEPVLSPGPKRLETSGGLKSASQWGTLEEAMHLGINSNKHIKIDSTISAPSIITRKNILKSSTLDEGAPVSNIEISGDRGPSITAVSVQHSDWDDSFDDDELPSLPSSPVPVETTTITVVEEDAGRKKINDFSSSDSNVVVVGTEAVHQNNFLSRNFQPSIPALSLSETQFSPFGLINSSSTSINSDSGRYSPRHVIPGEKDDSGLVTITMVAAEPHHVGAHSVARGHMVQSPTLGVSKMVSLSSSPEMAAYDSLQQHLVTVSHDWMHENGEIVMETSDHNISDEFMTPDTSPQKSMTQITLEGDGMSGYTVTEGTISRTVIISNPDSISPVNIVQTEISDESYCQ